MDAEKLLNMVSSDVPGLLTQLEHRPLIKHRDSVSRVIASLCSSKGGYRRARRT